MADSYDIAAICAHPDDAELVMGGTIARAAAAGRRVAMVDLTRGESGTRGTPETRAEEAAAAAKILGALHRESLSLPDGSLSPMPDQRSMPRPIDDLTVPVRSAPASVMPIWSG